MTVKELRKAIENCDEALEVGYLTDCGFTPLEDTLYFTEPVPERFKGTDYDYEKWNMQQEDLGVGLF